MGMAKVAIMAVGTVMILSGCMTDPHKAYTANQPKGAPIRNLTNMDLALGCLDQLLVDYRVQPVYLTSTGLPNRAGDKVGLASGIDMLKTSIGQLSRSNVFRYVDFSSLSSGQYMGNLNEPPGSGTHPIEAVTIATWAEFLRKYGNLDKLKFPGYIISGSISQMDNNTLSDQEGGGLGYEQSANVGAHRDQMVSVVTVDMHVLDSQGLQVLNGLTTKTSLTITLNPCC